MNAIVDIIITGFKSLPIVTIIMGLFAWLGKIWVNRIRDEEQYLINSKLENQKSDLQKEINILDSKLEIQNSLLSQAHQGATLDTAAITKEQIEALKKFWDYWLDFRAELGKFQTPHRILTEDELKKPEILAKVFTLSTAQMELSIKMALSHHTKIEKLRPFVPIQVYQHFLGLGTFYLRLAVKILAETPSTKVSAWYLDSTGNTDFSVTGLIAYGKSVGINLPEPTAEQKSYLLITTWIETLEDKMNELIYQFVNGSLKRQFEVHSAIKNLSNLEASEKLKI